MCLGCTAGVVPTPVPRGAELEATLCHPERRTRAGDRHSVRAGAPDSARGSGPGAGLRAWRLLCEELNPKVSPGTVGVGILLKDTPRDTEQEEASYPQGQPSHAPAVSPLITPARRHRYRPLHKPVLSLLLPREKPRSLSGWAAPALVFTWAKLWVQRQPWSGSTREVLASPGL